MRRVDMPMAEFRGFVLIEAVMDAERNLGTLQTFAKSEICGAS